MHIPRVRFAPFYLSMSDFIRTFYFLLLLLASDLPPVRLAYFFFCFFLCLCESLSLCLLGQIDRIPAFLSPHAHTNDQSRPHKRCHLFEALLFILMT
jgi:hypothetical protein